MNLMLDISIYFWTFVTWSFLLFVTSRIPWKYIEIIWNNTKKWINLDFHTWVSRFIFIFLSVLITILFIVPYILHSQNLQNVEYTLLKEYFYLSTWLIWTILIIVLFILPKKKELDNIKQWLEDKDNKTK